MTLAQQNGVSERLNRTQVECVRIMLADSNLPHRFWEEALSTAVYLRNRSPTKAVEGITPFEAWHGSKPDVSALASLDAVPMLMCRRLKDANLNKEMYSVGVW